MKKHEYLLVCLMEEAAEIQIAAAKALRFGLGNHHPERSETNLWEMSRECGELLAITSELRKEGAFAVTAYEVGAIEKSASIEKWEKVSIACGTLERCENVPQSDTKGGMSNGA